MNEDEPITSVGNIQIEYVTQKGQKGQVSKAADNTNNMCQQCVSNENLVSNQPSDSNMFNIQLNYNIDQALDSESWDSDFCVVFLHRSIEHLASDIKNIKDSLNKMGKYIKGKSIIKENPNNIKDLEGIGKAVWDFLSAIYDLHWDGLYVDNSKMSFRSKVKSKFNPQIIRTLVNNKDKELVKPTYVSPLSSPILEKMPKEVNEISKYFKKNDSPQKKSYAQTSSKP